MQMIKSRNLTSHTYDESTADELVILIRDEYYQEFIEFNHIMNDILRGE